MQFAEELPPLCPPANARDDEFSCAFRVIRGKNPTPVDFLSRRAQGLNAPPGVDDCRNASCSLFLEEDKAKKLLTYPLYKNGKIVSIQVPKGSGLSLIKGKHVDFWAYKHCSLVDLVEGEE